MTIFGLLDLRFEPNPRFLNREFIRSMSFSEALKGEVSQAFVGWVYLSFFVLSHFAFRLDVKSGSVL